MQRKTLGEKLSTHGMGRHDDLRMVVDDHEMLQTSGVVAMAVGDKHIVNGTEVYSQSLCVTYKHAAGSRVEQDAVTLRLQEYRQPMLCL